MPHVEFLRVNLMVSLSLPSSKATEIIGILILEIQMILTMD